MDFLLSLTDGTNCPVYLSGECKESIGAVIVLQEWWGLNANIQALADRFARAGFRALVPDLYRGKVATDADEAGHLFKGLDWASAVQDVAACVTYFQSTGSPNIGVVGFCMGGALAFLAGAKVPSGIKAIVPFYGFPPEEAADLGQLKVPVQAHWAKEDDWCTPAKVSALQAKLEAGSVTHAFYTYNAHHAFVNKNRPEVYDAAVAEVALDRTFAFFGKHLL
jgi:carboxymethylenebutenolidase